VVADRWRRQRLPPYNARERFLAVDGGVGGVGGVGVDGGVNAGGVFTRSFSNR
jgi:hypothetical protein